MSKVHQSTANLLNCANYKAWTRLPSSAILKDPSWQTSYQPSTTWCYWQNRSAIQIFM